MMCPSLFCSPAILSSSFTCALGSGRAHKATIYPAPQFNSVLYELLGAGK